MFRRIRGVLASGSVVALATTTFMTSSAEATGAEWSATIMGPSTSKTATQTSSVLDIAVFAAGRPVGVTAHVIAWPVGTALTGTANGQAVATREIGSGRSSNGQLSLPASALSSLEPAYRVSDGSVNVDILVDVAGRTLSVSTPIALGAHALARLDVATGAVTVARNLTTAEFSTARVSSNAALAGETTSLGIAPQRVGCLWVPQSTVKTSVEYHVEVTGTAAAPATLFERVKTVHEGGVAIADAMIGPFKQSGGVNVSNDNTSEADTLPSALSKAWANEMSYRLYRGNCSPLFSWRPAAMAALLTTSKSIPRPTYPTCALYTKDSAKSWGKDTGTTNTIDAGIEIPGVLKVSAKSSWTKGVRIVWDHSARMSTNVKWCGSSTLGAISSAKVEAHQA